MRRQGSDAEDQAADFLIEQGFTIVTRRYKTHSGELDLVALDGDDLVFVEVKHRKAGYLPEQAIGRQKIDRLHASASEYCRANEVPGRAYRFDVVAVGADGIRHHRGAFMDLVEVDSDLAREPNSDDED